MLDRSSNSMDRDAISLGTISDGSPSRPHHLSAIIATTRNPDLDVLAGGNLMRDTQLSEDIREVKLRLGIMNGDRPGEERIALGRAEDVRGLEKGGLWFGGGEA